MGKSSELFVNSSVSVRGYFEIGITEFHIPGIAKDAHEGYSDGSECNFREGAKHLRLLIP
jgi:hypothetical protein